MRTKSSEFPDSFKQERANQGVYKMDDQGDEVLMVLGLKELRNCARDHATFSSGKTIPGRIVVPSEEHIRSVRQIPVEVDPPIHTEFRALLDPWFKRPLDKEYQHKLTLLIAELLDDLLIRDEFEVVNDLALPLQSRALTLLLNVPIEEAETWISWGTHVFRSEGDPLDSGKAAVLDDYILQQIEKSSKNPGEDFYSVLLNSEVNNRKLTTEEVHGIVNLAFAGGRDTVINAVTNSISHFAEHADELAKIRTQPNLSRMAVEELVRYFSPLTHLGRVATENTQVCKYAVKANERISLCWASANRDETVFEDADNIKIDRKQNPHVAFGFGHHKCLGAMHARQLLNTLFTLLAEKVASMTIVDFEEQFETLGQINRKIGFQYLKVKFHGR